MYILYHVSLIRNMEAFIVDQNFATFSYQTHSSLFFKHARNIHMWVEYNFNQRNGKILLNHCMLFIRN